MSEETTKCFCHLTIDDVSYEVKDAKARGDIENLKGRVDSLNLEQQNLRNEITTLNTIVESLEEQVISGSGGTTEGISASEFEEYKTYIESKISDLKSDLSNINDQNAIILVSNEKEKPYSNIIKIIIDGFNTNNRIITSRINLHKWNF